MHGRGLALLKCALEAQSAQRHMCRLPAGRCAELPAQDERPKRLQTGKKTNQVVLRVSLRVPAGLLSWHDAMLSRTCDCFEEPRQ